MSSPAQGAASLQEAATALDSALVSSGIACSTMKTMCRCVTCTAAARAVCRAAVHAEHTASSYSSTECTTTVCPQQAAGTASEPAALQKAEELRDAGVLLGFGKARQVRQRVHCSYIGECPAQVPPNTDSTASQVMLGVVRQWTLMMGQDSLAQSTAESLLIIPADPRYVRQSVTSACHLTPERLKQQWCR